MHACIILSFLSLGLEAAKEYSSEMEKILLISCLATAASAFFFPFITMPSNQQQVRRVCIYSVNPARYQPKCIHCPDSAFPNVLRTCVNAAVMPPNITFAQATCVEQNCMINMNRGKRSVDVRHPQNLLEDEKRDPFLLPFDNGPEGNSADDQQKPLQQENGDKNSKEKSSEEKNTERQQLKKFEIIGTEEVMASDDYYEDELDYAALDG